ncbi:MAG TPA: TonB family protein [Usitatibacter sp.]|nr:TonB family protein [Usitatibacter sp.]
MQGKRSILLSAIALAMLAACAAPQILPHDPAPVAQLDPKTCPFIAINGALPVKYPAKAYESGQEGWVHLRFDIDDLGAATNVKQLGSSPPGTFDAAGLATLRDARFFTTGAKGCEFVLEYHKEPPK